MKFKKYTGGLASTNSYAIESNAGWLAIDAPEGFLDFLKDEEIAPTQLVLTHGHWDHIWDAAAIAKEFQCPVLYHRDDIPLCTSPDIMRAFGLPMKLEPIQATRYLDEGDILTHGQWNFQIFHIPGHCQGSICLYEPTTNNIFVGDVLFAGGVGRWDLPGGSYQTLIQGIHQKLLPLPPQTRVHSGHGSSTTIGKEKETNSFIS